MPGKDGRQRVWNRQKILTPVKGDGERCCLLQCSSEKVSPATQGSSGKIDYRRVSFWKWPDPSIPVMLIHCTGATLEQRVLCSNAAVNPQMLQLQTLSSLYPSQLTDKCFKGNPSDAPPGLPRSKWKITSECEIESKANNAARNWERYVGGLRRRRRRNNYRRRRVNQPQKCSRLTGQPLRAH